MILFLFNFRLSRGRKSIECAFGIMNSKFRIIKSQVSHKKEKIDTLVKALCILHNFIRTHDGIHSTSQQLQLFSENSSFIILKVSEADLDRQIWLEIKEIECVIIF